MILDNNSGRKFGRVLILASLILVFATSCTTTTGSAGGENRQPHSSTQKTKTMQLIIKFRNNISDPSTIAFVQELSRDAQATLFYIRPMSGGAHVFRVENISTASQLAEVIQRLAKKPEIIYVEQDSIMQHQQKQ